MVANRPRESSIVRGALEALNRLPSGRFRKRHGTAYGVAGDPDIYGTCTLVGGRHCELEAKTPGERPTALQERRLREWSEGGAIAGWFTSVDEALAIVVGAVPERIGRIRTQAASVAATRGADWRGGVDRYGFARLWPVDFVAKRGVVVGERFDPDSDEWLRLVRVAESEAIVTGPRP
jgi:hypothetical protein